MLIGVTFKYDYRMNKAWVSIPAGSDAVEELIMTIPGFGDKIEKVIVGGNGKTNKG